MSNASQQARVIAFEGIDGAGKSTVIELVAEHLRASGVSVDLARIGKEHVSKPIREIRNLTRDRTNLDLGGRAELLLYASREAQVIEQHVRPALARGTTVLLDRSVLTPVVLGAYGRGLELASCETIAELAAGGISPDLTLIFDVEPRTSRIRKRLDKIRSRRTRDGGRKGLAGSGFSQRIRDGYLAIAARDRLPVFHAERSTPRDIASRVIAQLETGSFSEQPEDAIPWWEVDPDAAFEQALESLPPLLRLYFTRGLPLGRAVRAELLEHEPELAVWAADIEDPVLERGAALVPELVLERLAESAAAIPLRRRLAATHPVAVARSLVGVKGDEADRLRERLVELAPGAVLESLSGRSDPFALALRERLWKSADIHERAISVRDCDDPDSWCRRERLLAKDPAVLISTLRGVGARVDPILRAYADRAPKAVLRALRGRADASAHALRRDLIETGREVIDSIVGLADAESWALRERCAERWPSAVVASLVGLAEHPLTPKLVERCRQSAPGNLFLKRRLHLLTAAEQAAGSDDLDD